MGGTEKQTGADWVISREFKAPKALVYRAFTEPERMAQWWGPKGFTNPTCELDVRVGGEYNIVMRAPDGMEYPCRGVYREIVANERLIMTVDMSGQSEEWYEQVFPNRDRSLADPVGEIIQTVTFEERKARTTVTVRTRFASAEIRDMFVKGGMQEGWSESFDKLAHVLVQMA